MRGRTEDEKDRRAGWRPPKFIAWRADEIEETDVFWGYHDGCGEHFIIETHGVPVGKIEHEDGEKWAEDRDAKYVSERMVRIAGAWFAHNRLILVEDK